MKALVTGGSGYFGELLITKLLENGYEVRNFDLINNHDADPSVEYIQGDIRDLSAVKRATKGIDAVFHNVAQVPLAKNKLLFEQVNHNGTHNILQASFESGCKSLVYTSSSAVYGVPSKNPVDENTTPHPQEAYGKAKLDGERACASFAKKGLNISIVRPRTILGHGRLGIFQILFEWVRTGKNIPVFDGGKNIYQFVHAEDLANCCFLSSKVSGFNTYNCGAKIFGTMRETLDSLCEHANTGSKVKSVPSFPAVTLMKLSSALNISPLGSYHALMYGKSMYFNTAKAESELNWSPKYSNIQMMIESYDWYIKNRELIIKNSNPNSHHKSPVKQGILKLVSQIL